MPPKAVFDVARAAALHAGGMPLAHVARLPEMPSAAALKRHLLEQGYEVWTGPWKLRSATPEQLRELHHEQDLSAEEIGKRFGCAASTVRRKLVEFNMPKGSGRHRPPRGADHWSWRGGTHIDSRGYVRSRCPDHPNAAKNGYVAEHRRVASTVLGRRLSSEEEVHHVDGNKLNNSPENLLVVPTGDHQRLHIRVYQELLALRKEVEALRGGARACSADQEADSRDAAEWKGVG
jgi:hypothetical protein